MHDPLPGSPLDSEPVGPEPVDAGVTQAFHDHRELLFWCWSPR